MVTREEISNVDLDAFFKDGIEEYTQQARQEIESKARHVKLQYGAFLQSGLSLKEFARKQGIDESNMRRRFKDWRLPIIEISARDIERIQADARKRNAKALCDCPNCLPCAILRVRDIS